jgi:hypothetical protein
LLFFARTVPVLFAARAPVQGSIFGELDQIAEGIAEERELASERKKEPRPRFFPDAAP